ncbi:hypothetical protein [Lichenicoccus sp.]|uniref:hypothetical protein n=1 Tax=Lichenicoccus sp. TaxID=2781899 RepID=UPI003D0DD2C3
MAGRFRSKLGGAVARTAMASGLLACMTVTAAACDGKSYSLGISAGQTVSGGGLVVRLDRARLFDQDPDKYIISVKDDGTILADHVLLVQHGSVDFRTRCGTVSIGAERKMFGSGTLTVNWSYF